MIHNDNDDTHEKRLTPEQRAKAELLGVKLLWSSHYTFSTKEEFIDFNSYSKLRPGFIVQDAAKADRRLREVYHTSRNKAFTTADEALTAAADPAAHDAVWRTHGDTPAGVSNP